MDQYLDMTDDDIEYFIAYNIGDEIENPFFGSSLHGKQPKIEEDITPETTEADIIEKLNSLDTEILEE